MKKECVILCNLQKEPIMVLDVKTFANSKDFLEFSIKCDENLRKTLVESATKDEKVKQLEKRIKRLELEIAFDRGDLTEEEYNDEISRL